MNFIRGHASVIIFTLPIWAILFIFRDFVFFGYFSGNGDILFNFFEYFNHRAKGGDVITQEILSGFPILVSVAGVWYYPINKLALFLLEPLNAYKAINIGNILLTYVVTYAYARKIRFSHILAVCAAFIFTTSGQLMLWAETVTNTNYYFLLPLVLLSIEGLVTSEAIKRKIMWVAVMGAALGMGWLSGHVQFVVYIHTFAFIYFIFVWKREKRKNFLSYCGGVGVSYLISFLIGFAQISVILLHKSASARSTGVGIGDFFWGAYLPQDLIHYFLPFFRAATVPFSNPNLYIGLVPLFLLVWALINFRKIADINFRFFSGVYVFCLLSAILYSPIGLALHYLPLWNSFREAPRIMFLGNFGAAMIVAFALKYFLDNKQNISTEKISLYLKRVLYYVVIPIGIVFTIVRLFFVTRLDSILQNYFMAHVYEKTAKMPKEHYFNLIHRYLEELTVQFSFLDKHYFLVAAGGFFILWFLRSLKIRSQNQLSYAVVAFIILNMMVTYNNRYAVLETSVITDEPKTAQFMKSATLDGQFRYFSVMPGFSLFDESLRCKATYEESFILQKELLQPNINMLYGIDAVDGYDNFMPRTLSEILGYVGSEQSVTPNLLANENISLEDRLNKIAERKGLLRMMNVKYVVSHYEIKDADFIKVFEEKVGNCGTRVIVYELKGTWPRYFLSNTTDTYSGFDSVANSDLSVPVIIGEGLVKKTGKKISVIKPEYLYDGYRFELNAVEDTNLFIGNAWLPNYKATLDGKTIEIKKANHAYMYVPVPQGDHEIKIIYEVPFK